MIDLLYKYHSKSERDQHQKNKPGSNIASPWQWISACILLTRFGAFRKKSVNENSKKIEVQI